MVKRGFGVGTLEVSFDEGLEEAIERIVTDTNNFEDDLLGPRKGKLDRLWFPAVIPFCSLRS